MARYAGDDFVVLLPDTKLSGARRLAGKLQGAIRKGLAVPEMDGGDDRVSVSIGVAELRQDAEQLFLDADNALYASKEKGRDVVILCVSSERRRAARGEAVPLERMVAMLPWCGGRSRGMCVQAVRINGRYAPAFLPVTRWC